jgi:hypothetical protein
VRSVNGSRAREVTMSRSAGQNATSWQATSPISLRAGPAPPAAHRAHLARDGGARRWRRCAPVTEVTWRSSPPCRRWVGSVCGAELSTLSLNHRESESVIGGFLEETFDKTRGMAPLRRALRRFPDGANAHGSAIEDTVQCGPHGDGEQIVAFVGQGHEAASSPRPRSA